MRRLHLDELKELQAGGKCCSLDKRLNIEKKNLGIVDEKTSDEQMVLCKHTEWVLPVL